METQKEFNNDGSGLPLLSFFQRLQMIAPWNGAETLKLTKVQKRKIACRIIISLGWTHLYRTKWSK